MVVVMKRKIVSEMMTTYFPSLLLIAITFATTFFKPVFFEAALSVNLTTMLVMTTIFISKMEGLPPTSDIKMIGGGTHANTYTRKKSMGGNSDNFVHS